MSGQIFISYRREDSAGFAGRLFDRLRSRFGENRIFMDVAGINWMIFILISMRLQISNTRTALKLVFVRRR